ncbi:MAG: hypothetical protein KDJ40_00815 [Hyphomicrobiales bacterium]|nr:hypothetical protein [Hyphomicrobiales bacterium]
MALKPPTPEDIGAKVTYWPWDNRTEEGVLERIEDGYFHIRLPSGGLIKALARQVHRGHYGS